MTRVQLLESAETIEVVFAGDSVRLAGQIDYPHAPCPSDGYPLLFIIHHAGGNTRDIYAHYTRAALDVGYAVFRWDKRGTGRSGASARGSVTQDAVNAYEIALEQPNINRHQAVILAQCSGTVLFGSSYGLFARVEKPVGTLLIGNKLDEEAILAIDTRVQIVMGSNDWVPANQFAKAAAQAHNAAYKHGAYYYIASHADRLLMDTHQDPPTFHREAKESIQNWLFNLCPATAST